MPIDELGGKGGFNGQLVIRLLLAGGLVGMRLLKLRLSGHPEVP